MSKREQKTTYKNDLEDTSITAKGIYAKKNFSDAAGTFVTGVDIGTK